MADARINLYHNLSVMLDAGVPITRTLQSVHKAGRVGRLFKQIEQEVNAGSSVTDAVEKHKHHFQPLDRVLIEVGEQTGQSAEMFEELAQWYAFRQRLNRTIRSGLLLPICYIHATALIVPVIAMAFSGFDLNVYFRGVFGILAMFYIPAAIILGIIFLTPKTGPLRWGLDIFAINFPLLGQAIRELELSRFCKVFAITYRAGIPIVEAARMATNAVSNRPMYHRLKGGYENVKEGELMSTGFGKSVPGEFLGIWQVGEETGNLDDSARRLGDNHAFNAEMKFTAIAQWVPRLVYGIVCGVMIYYIFVGYSRIYGNLSL